MFENIVWSHEQEMVLASKSNLLVNGIAGTGKTMLALKKAIDLKKDGKSVCLIVFTKALKTFIESSLEKEFVGNSIVVNYEYEWNNLKENYDYIIIDEYQDFSLKTLQGYQKSAKIGTYFFGDIEQQLYKIDFKDKENTISPKQLNELKFDYYIKLWENFRIPKHVIQLARGIRILHKNRKMLFSERFLNKTGIYSFDTHTNEIEFLVKFISENFKNNSIGILLNKNNGTTINNLGVNSLFDSNFENIPSILELKKILTEKLGMEIGYKYERENQLNFTKKENINLLTIHSSKGLEFDIVILPFSRMANEFFHENQLYVALTRSKKTVLITYSGQIQYEYIGIQKNLIDGELKTMLKEGVELDKAIEFMSKQSKSNQKHFFNKIKN